MSLLGSEADKRFEKKMGRLHIGIAILTTIFMLMDFHVCAIILAIHHVILHLICIRKDLMNIHMEIQDLNFYMKNYKIKDRYPRG